MATYIPGVADYIPQLQPFQPDYNFLGNMLQTKQSQYDSNYKQLSQTYGTLLNSDMMREDNIQKRNEFFKMIDNDIKRVSGLDLSLQQNTDSANKVFDSFFQNKDMVKDMTFTKEYNKQLQAGEALRNCIDQEKCGGKYSDVSAQALHYRAEEFKKASKADAMTMSPGRFVPQINMQEKATKYLETLLGKGGDGGFGVQNVVMSQDGKYNITLKNGALLNAPLQQLLQAQYSKDQDIIDWNNTQAYVNRKGFVSQNLEKFGGDENAAEDEYFKQLDGQFQKSQIEYQQAVEEQNAARAKNNLLAENIKKNGSTGNDKLAKDYVASGTDAAIAQSNSKYTEDTHNIAKSVFEAGENRAQRRNRADQLFGRSLMNKEISESATRAAAMTGGIIKKDADPYAKSYYDFSLDMQKMTSQYNLMDRNAMRNHVYDLNKQKALKEYEKRASAVGLSNQGVYVDGVKGTTATAPDEEGKETIAQVAQETASASASASAYASGYGNTLLGILQDPNASNNEKIVAKDTLQKIYGVAKKGADGSYTSYGFDPNTESFIDNRGVAHNKAEDVSGVYNWKDLYTKAKTEADSHSSVPSHASYLETTGKKLNDQYDLHLKQLNATSKAWVDNNKNVKSYGGTEMSGQDLKDWNNMFAKDNQLKSLEDYTKDYILSNPSSDEKDANDAYVEMNEKYNKIYSSGTTTGKDVNGNLVPLVRSTHGASMFNNLGGGTSAGGGVIFEFDSDSPAALGTRGLNTFYNDAQNTTAIWTIGNYATKEEATKNMALNGANAKIAVDQLMHDLRVGNLTKAEKANVVGQIMYMDVALGDKNMVGTTIKFPPSWLKKYQDSAKEITWADDTRLSSEGISMYVDKKTAKNEFTETFKMKPYDYILQHDNAKISYDMGNDHTSTLTINPRNPDGSFSVIGDVGGYDAKGIWQPVSATKTYYNDVGGQNLYTSLDVWMKQISDANLAYADGKQPNRVYDPKKLPEVQSLLQASLGGEQPQMDPNQMFMQGVNNALYGK